MKYKVGDRVYWNDGKWRMLFIRYDVRFEFEFCILLNILNGSVIETFTSDLKPIKTCK